jgi:choline dehydrogenase
MYDYVIVGAGSAGCVLAARLSEDPGTRVLLLEAGPAATRREIQVPIAFSQLFRTEVDWNYSTAPEPELGGREIYWPRGRTLGGSSSINAMVYMRGNATDYDGWEKLGNEGWSFREVLPYFKKSESNERGAGEFHGAGGPLNVADLRYVNPMTHAFLAAAERAGLPAVVDFNGPAQDGAGVVQVTQKNGRRWSSASAYLMPAMGRPNLKVVTGALVTRVLVEGGRAVGVSSRPIAGAAEIAEQARREVILCGGAINSPQLLMLSGIGPPEVLEAAGVTVVHALPGVGRNLQDHVATGLHYRVSRPISLLNATGRRPLAAFLLRGRGMLTSNVAEGSAFVRSDPSLGAPDLQYVFAPALYSGGEEAEVTEHGFTLGVMLLTPRSTGTISLASNDPAAPPVIRANYFSDAEGADLSVIKKGVHLGRRIAAQGPLAELGAEEIQVWDEPLGEAGPTRSSGARARLSTTRSAPAGWAPTRWRSSTTSCACAGWPGCASWTPRSCPPSSAATRTRRP